MTTMIVKLENISMGISEIKSEMNNIKCDLTQRERLVIVEESCKSAHKRIDTAWKGEAKWVRRYFSILVLATMVQFITEIVKGWLPAKVLSIRPPIIAALFGVLVALGV